MLDKITDSERTQIAPVGFTFKHNNLKLSIATDLGFPSSAVKEKMKDSDFIVLESNHDEEMLMKSRRPHVLKKRILGRHGHLSNTSAGNLLSHLLHGNLQKVILAHLSQECNRPKLALDTIQHIVSQEDIPFPKIETAFQDRISPLYTA